MALKPVATLIKEKEVVFFKELIDKLRDRQPEIQITPFKYGSIGDNKLVSFKVSENHYTLILESMVTNNLKIILKDEESEKIIKKAETVSLAREMNGWGDIKKSESPDNTKETKSLEAYIKEGNYSEVIRISRNINFGNEVVQKAKNSIPIAVTNAIKKATYESEQRKSSVEENIKLLIKIASDINLKNLNLPKLLKQAGFSAIQLCANDPNQFEQLISICNNSSIHNMINVKAAIAFSKITLDKESEYEEIISIAVRNLNTRWLSIAGDVAKNDLSKDELTQFNRLIDYLFEKRNN